MEHVHKQAETSEGTAKAAEVVSVIPRWEGESNLELLDRREQILQYAAKAALQYELGKLLDKPEDVLARRSEFVNAIPDPKGEFDRYIQRFLLPTLVGDAIIAYPFFLFQKFIFGVLLNFPPEYSVPAAGLACRK